MRERHTKTDRAAIVLHVWRVAIETERLGEVRDDLRIMVERVRERLGIRPVAMSEPWVIRRYEVIAIGQPCNERLEHPRRRRQAVQQEQRRRVLRARLPVKDREPVDVSRSVERWMLPGRQIRAHCACLSDRNAVRSSAQKSSGCSHAAKCPPLGSSLK